MQILCTFLALEKNPCGDFKLRFAPDFKIEKKPLHGYSMGAIEWMDYEMTKNNTKIYHMLNSNSEIEIGSKKVKVDGYDRESGSIYQFQGCYYHSCTDCFADKMDEIHPYYNITFAENRDRTRRRIEYLESLGYTVHEKWECEWRQEKKRLNIKEKNHSNKSLGEQDIIGMIKEDKIFGLAMVDIHTPDHLKKVYDEFPLIFKNTEVSRDDI